MKAPSAPSALKSAVAAASGAWRAVRRAERLHPSVVGERLKLIGRPSVTASAGGWPTPECFPVDALLAVSVRVLAGAPRAALQRAPSEGIAPRRERIAADWAAHGRGVAAAGEPVATGSPQAIALRGGLLAQALEPAA